MSPFEEIFCISIINYINIIIWYLGPFFLMKCRFRLTPLRIVLFVTVQFMLAGAIRYFLSIPYYPKSIIETLVVLIPVITIFTDVFWKRVVVAGSAIGILAIGKITANILIIAITGGSAQVWQDGAAESFMLGQILWVLISYTLTMAFIVLYHIFIGKAKLKGMLLYVIVPVYQVIMLCLYYYNCRKYNNRVILYGICFLVLGLCVDFLIIYFQRIMEKNLDTKARLEEINRQREYELAYYRQVNRSMEQMRTVRHDFMNQLQTARRMIQTRQERDKIEKLLAEAEERLCSACPGFREWNADGKMSNADAKEWNVNRKMSNAAEK